MADDITNKTVATLLVVAIVVSIGGTYIVLQRAPGISGLFTATNQTGTVTFTQQGVLSIKLDDMIASFGNVTSTSAGACDVYTDGTAAVNCAQTVLNDNMLLENDGNVFAKVDVNSTKDTEGQNFPLGTGGLQEFKGTENEVGSCPGTLQTALTTLPGAGGTAATLCTQMDYVDASDTITIDYHLHIGNDLTFGNYTENVTFLASLA
jgi:hypothetical protein